MPKNRAGRFVYALLVAVLLLVIGRNFYHRSLNHRLTAAVQSGNLAAARDLLTRGADAATRLPPLPGAKQGMSILDQAVGYTASSGGQSQIACLLIQHGALRDTDAAQINYYLATACRNGNPTLVRLLLEHGASVGTGNPGNPGDPGVVEQAAGYADQPANLSADPVTAARLVPRLQVEADKKQRLAVSQQIVRMLKEHGARLTIWQAARIDDVDALRAALDSGTPIDQPKPDLYATRTYKGPTALILAAKAGNLNAVRLLLDRGANVNVQSSNPASALDAAIMGRHLEIARLLLQHGAYVNKSADMPADTYYPPLSTACGSLPELVPDLLQRGADVKAMGGYALGAAISGRHPELVKLLLQRGANARGKGGNLLLQAAIRYQPELVPFFLAQGASARGTELISEAVSHGRANLIAPLVRAGADIKARKVWVSFGRNMAEQTVHNMPLIEALGQEPRMTRVLLEQGADPNAPNSQGVTPLLAAAQAGKSEATRLLLAHGAKVDETGTMRHTPLYYARRHNFTEVAALLQQAGGHEK